MSPDTRSSLTLPRDDPRASPGTRIGIAERALESQTPTPPRASVPLAPALALLDARLSAAVAEAELRFGPDAAADPYRGMYLTPADVARSLARAPGLPGFADDEGPSAARLGTATPELERLGAVAGLAPFELALVVVAVAPDVDLRYERTYAFLQDDVTRKRATVDLALNLLCATAREKLQRRRCFSGDAPLLTSGTLALAWESGRAGTSLLAKDLDVADSVSNFLLGIDAPGEELAPLLRPAPLATDHSPLPAPERRRLARLLRRSLEEGPPLRLLLRGAAGSGRRRTAWEIAERAGSSVLTVDLAAASVSEAELDRLLPRALLEARLRGWVPLVSGLETASARFNEAAATRVLHRLAAHDGPVLLSGSSAGATAAASLPGVVHVPMTVPSERRRRAMWSLAMRRAELPEPPGSVDLLAGRFELGPLQISGAVASTRAEWEAAGDAGDGDRLEGLLHEAARARAGRELVDHGQRVPPVFTFDDLVLEPDGKRQLGELCLRVEHRRRVMADWGFGARLPLGSGVNALFSGQSGTGKTMAAQVVAGELGLDLYRIDLSQVVSKYIGETEKNLGRIFDQAASSNAILFFDEADALFGKRSEVKDAHDRYANIEIGYLLQKMEEYRGVTILATNLRQNMDEAFVRRLAFHVHFPMPDEEARLGIWERVFPPGVPLDDTVDLGFMAHRFRVAGGNIRNVALAAAFLAAGDGTPVAMRHLVLGMRREFQKMGKVCVEADFEPYYHVLDQDGSEARS